MSPKNTIRQEILALRRALSGDEIRRRSHQIQRQLLSLSAVQQANLLGLYSPVHGEVETAEVLDFIQSSDKQACFPQVREQGIRFIKATKPASFRPGRWGILEPATGEITPLGEIDCILVPGVAFDRQGHRVGFGKGYYDRALQNYHGVKIGLAYDFQLVPELPRDSGDIRCDWIVSESQILGRFL